MAARNFAPVRAHIRELIPVVMSFTGNGGSNPTACKGIGAPLASITRTGTGTYQVVLEDKFSDCVSLVNGIETSSPADWTLEQKATVSSNTWTLTFTTNKAGTATDMASTERLHFCAWMRNSKAALTQG